MDDGRWLRRGLPARHHRHSIGVSAAHPLYPNCSEVPGKEAHVVAWCLELGRRLPPMDVQACRCADVQTCIAGRAGLADDVVALAHRCSELQRSP